MKSIQQVYIKDGQHSDPITYQYQIKDNMVPLKYGRSKLTCDDYSYWRKDGIRYIQYIADTILP